MSSFFSRPTPAGYDISVTFRDYTFVYDRFTCISWVYPLHMIFAYLVVISGLFAMASRIIPFLKPYHSLSGKLYLIFMFWCMATSLVIHNTGLPFPIIVSFLYLLFSISFGWIAIHIHSKIFENTLWKRIVLSVKGSNSQTPDIVAIRKEEVNDMLSSKTFLQRLFSLKTLHGMLMVFSWAQMAGRSSVTNPFSSWEGCWTYPAYKTETGEAVFVNSTKEGYLPIGEANFLVVITAPNVAGIIIVGVLFSIIGGIQAHFYNKRKQQSLNEHLKPAKEFGEGDVPLEKVVNHGENKEMESLNVQEDTEYTPPSSGTPPENADAIPQPYVPS